jgi:NTE family protein
MGLWKVLNREGIEVNMAVGCSGGSLYAAVIALKAEYEHIKQMNRGWWKDTFSRLHYPSLVRASLPKLFGFNEQFGLVADGRIGQNFKDIFGEATFADAPVPLYIVACDFYTGEKVVLTDGLIRDAVRASIAIPVLLRPWRIKDRLLIDGGAVDPLPVDVAIREGCDIILAMGFETSYQTQFGSLLNIIGQTTSMLTNNLLRSTYAFYSMAHHAEIIPILPAFDRPIGLNESQKIPYIEEQGERAAEEQMPYLKRLLNSLSTES